MATKKAPPISFTERALFYDTDKISHGYIPYYEKHLPTFIDSLLEIGAFHGESIRMWKAIFPEANISTMDLFGEFPEVKDQLEELGVTCYKGDQSNYDDLYKITPQFDIVIEDGSHMSDHQQITFKHLFFNNLKKGGIYILEDLHCCVEPYYWGSKVKQFEDTILWAFQNWTSETGIPNNMFFDDHQKGIFDKVIADVKLYDNKIAFIWKK